MKALGAWEGSATPRKVVGKLRELWLSRVRASRSLLGTDEHAIRLLGLAFVEIVAPDNADARARIIASQRVNFAGCVLAPLAHALKAAESADVVGFCDAAVAVERGISAIAYAFGAGAAGEFTSRQWGALVMSGLAALDDLETSLEVERQRAAIEHLHATAEERREAQRKGGVASISTADIPVQVSL